MIRSTVCWNQGTCRVSKALMVNEAVCKCNADPIGLGGRTSVSQTCFIQLWQGIAQIEVI